MFRIQLTDTGLFFANTTDAVCTIEAHTTLFNNQDEFLGSLSMPGDLPLNPHNKALINNAHYILSNGRRSFRVMTWLGDEPYKSARFEFTIEAGSIKYTLFFDKSDITTLLNTKLIQASRPGDEDPKIFDSYALMQAYMMETVNGTAATHPMVFAPYKNDGAYKAVAPDHYGDYSGIDFPVEVIINRWEMDETGTGAFKVDAGVELAKETQTPFFYIVYILKRIARFLDLEIEGKWIRQESSQRLVIESNIAVAGDLINDYTAFMPDISIKDLFIILRETCGLIIDTDITRRVLFIESISNLVATDQTVDLRACGVAGTYRETSNNKQAYVISRAADSNDTAFTDDEKAALPTLTIGDTSAGTDSKTISLKTVATKMIVEPAPSQAGIGTPVGANWRIPYLKQSIEPVFLLGQLRLKPYSERRNFGVRLLYYHGMKPNDAGYDYPYVSADNLNTDLAVISDYTLALDASAESFQELRAYYRFIYNSRPFEQHFKLSKKQFFNVSAARRLLIRDDNGATVNAFLDTISADLGNNALIDSAITVYPHLVPNNTAQITNESPVIPPPEPPFDNGIVYAQLTMINYETNEHLHDPEPYLSFDADIQVKFYADEALTTPKEVVDLEIRIRQRRTNSSDGIAHDITLVYTANGDTVIPYTNMPTSSNEGGSTTDWSYALLDSDDYIIVP